VLGGCRRRPRSGAASMRVRGDGAMWWVRVLVSGHLRGGEGREGLPKGRCGAMAHEWGRYQAELQHRHQAPALYPFMRARKRLRSSSPQPARHGGVT